MSDNKFKASGYGFILILEPYGYDDYEDFGPCYSNGQAEAVAYLLNGGPDEFGAKAVSFV